MGKNRTASGGIVRWRLAGRVSSRSAARHFYCAEKIRQVTLVFSLAYGPANKELSGFGDSVLVSHRKIQEIGDVVWLNDKGIKILFTFATPVPSTINSINFITGRVCSSGHLNFARAAVLIDTDCDDYLTSIGPISSVLAIECLRISRSREHNHKKALTRWLLTFDTYPLQSATNGRRCVVLISLFDPDRYALNDFSLRGSNNCTAAIHRDSTDLSRCVSASQNHSVCTDLCCLLFQFVNCVVEAALLRPP